jgi:predicted DNA-binding transcriptional regulator AlpA
MEEPRLTIIEKLLASQGLLSRKQLAPIIGVEVGTLTAWVSRNRGPAFIKVGDLVRYDPVEVARWLESQTVEPTSTTAPQAPKASTPLPDWLQPNRPKAQIAGA